MLRTVTRILGVAFLSSLVLVPLLIYLNWQHVSDWWRLRDYDPPHEIAQLSDNTTMTDYGRRPFYVYQPELNSREEFNQNCRDSRHSIVLGCYVQYQGIYIFDVDDERLDGVKEVTAAHEMLHVAYERLSLERQAELSQQLQKVYRTVDNDRIKAAIESYREVDPAIVDNELHSIIGTEVDEIGEELERYYSQYFADRHRVVSYARSYEQAFLEQKSLLDKYDNRLLASSADIAAAQAALNQESQELIAERAQLEALFASGAYEEYVRLARPFNQKVQGFNDRSRALRAEIDRHNALVEERNQVALESNRLIQAIDSRPPILPTH